MRTMVTAFGCWNNEVNISEPGQAGKLHPMLFETEDAARTYYEVGVNRDRDDPIVRVTVELLKSKS